MFWWWVGVLENNKFWVQIPLSWGLCLFSCACYSIALNANAVESLWILCIMIAFEVSQLWIFITIFSIPGNGGSSWGQIDHSDSIYDCWSWKNFVFLTSCALECGCQLQIWSVVVDSILLERMFQNFCRLLVIISLEWHSVCIFILKQQYKLIKRPFYYASWECIMWLRDNLAIFTLLSFWVNGRSLGM